MKSRAALTLGLVFIALLGVGGCQTSASRQQLAEIRSNPAPELSSLSASEDEVDNQLTVTFDTNVRLLSRDLGSFFLLDRPSHLSPAPVR